MGLLFGRGKRAPKRKSITRHIPFIRFIGPGATLVGMIALIGCLLTGQIDLSSLDNYVSGNGGPGAGESAVQPIRLETLGQKSPESIRIATFNISLFDKRKSSDVEVINAIARIISQFDVIAIQEVHGGDAVPIQNLVDLLNASGARYTATVSQPIGRTPQAESYAYVWDESRVQLVPRSAYVVMDSADRMHREPMVASFQSRPGSADGRQPFRFTLINAQAWPQDPQSASTNNELDVLDDVYVSVRQFDHQQTGEEDFILLGDLNVGTSGLRELGQIPDVVSIAGDIGTDNARTVTHHHMMVDRRMTREFTGRFGVVDLQKDFGLTAEQAAAVSEHLPLWAEFSAYEMSGLDGGAPGVGQGGGVGQGDSIAQGGRRNLR